MIYTTPIEAAFEMQRQSLRLGEELLEDTVELQREGAEMFIESGLAVQRSAQRQGVELTQQLFRDQLETFSSMSEDAVRSAVDRQFDEGADLTRRLTAAQVEYGADLVEQLVAGQLDMFLSASDDAARSAMTRQFEGFNSFHSDSWDAFEALVGEALADLSARQRDVASQTTAAVLSAQQAMEEQTIEGVE